MDQVLLSIVIPAYNPPEKLFRQCINSINIQNFRDYEVIVIDDGSSKENAEIMDEIAASNSRIRIVHQANKGEGGARNSGLQLAQGKYLMFVDADDCVGDNWLEISVDLAECENADMVCGRIKMCEDPAVEKNTDYEKIIVKDTEIYKVQRDFLLGYTSLLDGLDYLDIGVCAKLYKREKISGLKFPVGVKLSADQVYNHMAVRCFEKIIITNCISYYYVMNPESISHIHHKDAVDIMMYSLSLVQEHLFENDEVKSAFWFHVTEDFQKGIHFSCFNDCTINNIVYKSNCVKKSLTNPLINEAFKNIDYGFYKNKITKLKIWLLKNNHYVIYSVLKQIYYNKR